MTTLKRARQTEEEEVTAADYTIEISGLRALSSEISKDDVAKLVARAVTSSWAERRKALQRRRLRRWSLSGAFTRALSGLWGCELPCTEESRREEEAEPLVESNEWMLGVGEKCHRREAVTLWEAAEQARRGLISAPTMLPGGYSGNGAAAGAGKGAPGTELSAVTAESGKPNRAGGKPNWAGGESAAAPRGLSETVLSVVHNVEIIAPDAGKILRVDAEERRVRLRDAELRACSARARAGDPVANAMLRLRSAAAWRPWRSAENLRWRMRMSEALDNEGFDEADYHRSVNRIKAGRHRR